MDFIRVPIAVVVILFICWLMSDNRARVPWRLVFIGLAMQFTFALLVLGSSIGQQVLRAISDGVTQVVASSA
ncbi:MAG: Na+ dependent nucleoside transporter N-terminal domain-containing protein, partial [Pseudomonadales bacterium]|nr:Na+ dependent nucleoside transporter N-terminal domain-containing protein [Pseudomonadales bacterium]